MGSNVKYALDNNQHSDILILKINFGKKIHLINIAKWSPVSVANTCILLIGKMKE